MGNGGDQSEGSTHNQSENAIVNVPPAVAPPSPATTTTIQVPQSPPPPTPIADDDPPLNAAPSQYHYTEGLSPYSNLYTTVWDNLFNINLESSSSVNFSHPLAPLHSNFDDIDAIVLPSSLQTPPPDGNNNNSPELLASPPPTLVVDESNDNHLINPSPLDLTTPTAGGEGESETLLTPPTPTMVVDESNDNPSPPTPTVGGESDTQHHQLTLSTTTSVVNESDDNQVTRELENHVTPAPATLPSAATILDGAEIANATPTPPSVIDSSIKRRKQGRYRKNRRVRAQSDGAAATPQDQTRTPQEEAAPSQLQMQTQFWGSKQRIPQPTFILIRRGEDVAEKITSFAKERRIDFITGAVGVLSVVELLLQEKTVTLKGAFEIIYLVGNFLPPKKGDQHMTSQLSIKVVGSDGEVFGGPVQGRLIADSVIQMVAFTWTSVGHDEEMENNLQ